jgi:hypothetical protein
MVVSHDANEIRSTVPAAANILFGTRFADVVELMKRSFDDEIVKFVMIWQIRIPGDCSWIRYGF